MQPAQLSGSRSLACGGLDLRHARALLYQRIPLESQNTIATELRELRKVVASGNLEKLFEEDKWQARDFTLTSSHLMCQPRARTTAPWRTPYFCSKVPNNASIK